MAEFSREALRQALIDRVPDGPAVAGVICVAAMRRAGLELDWDGNTCYFAANSLSVNCFGEVSLDGNGVTGSEALDGGCLREQEVDGDLINLQRLTDPEN